MNKGEQTEGRARLESWKEISSYLERSIKTCQRWEVELGLPIHRLDGTPSARVFANPEELDAWIAEKLSHIRERPTDPPKNGRDMKKTLRVAAGALVLLGVAAVPARLWIWHPPIDFPPATTCVAFLPLENAAGDEKLEAWRTSFPHLISMDFVQSRVIGSWNAGDLFLTLEDMKLWDVPKLSPEDVVRIGQRVGCGHIATGSLARSGDGFVLDLALRNAQTAEVTHSFRETCAGEEGLFDMADDLSSKIKLALNIPRRLVAHDIDEKVADITTRSPGALHLYCQADRLCWQDKPYEASLVFQKAAEADPRFAEAYYGLFRACRGTLARDEIIRYGEKAVEFSDRLNVWSRYQLRGDFYQNFQKDYEKAIAAYKGLLALMGDDLAEYSLAQIYWDLEEYDKAIPLLESARRRVKENEHIVRLLAVCHAGRGDFARAEAVLDEHFQANPKVSANFLHIRAVYAADQGKYDEALSFMDKLQALYPNSPRYVRYGKSPVLISMDDFANAESELRAIVVGEDETERVYAAMGIMGLYLTQGKLQKAKEEAQRGIALAESLGDPGWVRMSHFNMACLDRLSGDLAEALRQVDLACPDQGQAGIYDLGTLHLKALITLELGRKDDFEKEIEGIRQIIERERYPKLMRIYDHLLGQRELRENNVEKAIDHLWKALKLLPSPLGKSNADTDSARYYLSLAEAYLRAGAYPRAAEMYAKVPPYWEQRFNSGDIYARSFYGRARAHELYSERAGLTDEQRRAEKAKAVKSYRKFLSLWGQADPVLAPEVNDARARLATFESESSPIR
ncbi:MAG: tetratricopeptide repeat protein [Candidatus Aminicenantes bacterium]|nr:tetratricopeptide repeat protein [Candidatus Aminicenantes bacterium]